MQKFMASQGLMAPNLGSVQFQEGDGGSLIAKAAFAHGNPAVTIQNNVYVKLGHWDQFAPGTAGFFEEALHTIQWDQSGAANFGLSWVLGSAMGALATGDGHNSPIEAQAGGWSINLAKAYAASGGCPK